MPRPRDVESSRGRRRRRRLITHNSPPFQPPSLHHNTRSLHRRDEAFRDAGDSAHTRCDERRRIAVSAFKELQMRRTSFTLVIALLALASSATAQGTAATVSGTIRERGTERAIPGVQVRVTGTQRGAVTDATGTYRIVGVPAGTVTLATQLLGYAPQSRSVL